MLVMVCRQHLTSQVYDVLVCISRHTGYGGHKNECGFDWDLTRYVLRVRVRAHLTHPEAAVVVLATHTCVCVGVIERRNGREVDARGSYRVRVVVVGTLACVCPYLQGSSSRGLEDAAIEKDFPPSHVFPSFVVVSHFFPNGHMLVEPTPPLYPLVRQFWRRRKLPSRWNHRHHLLNGQHNEDTVDIIVPTL